MQLAEDFWNFRGSHKIAKIIDVGTQMSLVRRASGKFVLLDSFDIDGDERETFLTLTNGGADVEAILNVHPYHTLHCAAVHDAVPHARLIGTLRHRQQIPTLPWEAGVIEDVATQAEFGDIFEFSVPAGVDLYNTADVHVGSVLVRHRKSGIVHVDDTLNVFAGPGPLEPLLPQSRLKFHPQLAKALQDRPGATEDYANWARALADEWAGTRIVCAAHMAIRRLPQGGWRQELLKALDDIESTLADHREKHAKS